MQTFKKLYSPETLNVPDKVRPAADYMMHAIYVGRALRRDHHEFVPLNAKILEGVSRGCVEAKRCLIEAGEIECDGRYLPGSKSLGYRWTRPYATAKRVDASPAITRSLARTQVAQAQTHSIGARHLIRQLDHVHIDGGAARSTIATLSPRQGSAWDLTTYRDFLSTTVRMIEDRHLYHIVDRFGRLHTPITNLHRALRKHLFTVSPIAEQLGFTNIDIRNSQPLVMGLLLIDPLSHPLPDSDLLTQLPASATDQSVQDQSDQDLLTLDQGTGSLLDIPYVRRNEAICYSALSDAAGIRYDARRAEYGHDVADYVRTCEGGKFYESLMRFSPRLRDAAEFMTPEEIDAERGKFKVACFADVFFGPTRPHPNPVAKLFGEIWPGVAKRIEAEKEGPDGYPSLARRMQRAESRLMIDRVGARLAREMPDVPVATIHDSYLVAPQHAVRVEGIIRDEWSLAGLHPSIATKPC